MLFGDYHGNFAKTFGRLFRKAKTLHVIFLSEASYDLEDILHNFSKLVHLRFLRIKSANYWNLSLPSVLFRLYHLEVVDLQSVYCFLSSTRNMSNLVKLRHFIVQEDLFHLHSDIFGVGKLNLLQELREFRVRKESDGFDLSQLGQLTEVGGSLVIYNLEKVQTKEEAQELKLRHKNHIRELTLEWDVGRSNKDPSKEENVLGSLVPHSSLQQLCIKGHGGTIGPSWLCENLSVKSLESLCLDGVSWKNLPPLGEMWMVNERGEEYLGCSISSPSFHNLKRLELSNISWLQKWVGNGACPFFSHLEVVIIRYCSELIELPFSNPTCCQAQQGDKMGWFPRLRELVIVHCPKLVSLPPIPWRTRGPCSAEIAGVGSGFKRLVYPEEYRSELSLKVVGNDDQGDVLWNGLIFSNLTDLKGLFMDKCPLPPLDHLQVLTSLKRIDIRYSTNVLPRVQSAGHGIYRFPVEDFGISTCDTSGKELTLLLSFFPNLSIFVIHNCGNITGLGVAEHPGTASREQQKQTREDEEITTSATSEGLLLLPSSLQEVWISECPKVEVREGGLHRLRSLRVLSVRECPEFLSSSFLFLPTCLQHLTLYRVGHMVTLQALSNLTSLTELNLTSLTAWDGSTSLDECLWPLLAHGRLTKLTLDVPDLFTGSDPSLMHDKEVFSRSCKILHLETRNDTGFLATPICSFLYSTLTRLDLNFATGVDSLTKDQEEALQLLTSLQELGILGTNMRSLPAGLHRLINLKILTIHSCWAIQSLPRLPSSLQELEIGSCPSFKSLPNSFPSSLEKLEISDCSAIKSLPKDCLPSSMRELDVQWSKSEELKRVCRRLIGTIPIIRT